MTFYSLNLGWLLFLTTKISFIYNYLHSIKVQQSLIGDHCLSILCIKFIKYDTFFYKWYSKNVFVYKMIQMFSFSLKYYDIYYLSVTNFILCL